MFLSNSTRAARVETTLAAYRSYTGDAPCEPDENVLDILTDLRHYCERHNLPFERLNDIARTHYQAELAEQGGAS